MFVLKNEAFNPVIWLKIKISKFVFKRSEYLRTVELTRSEGLAMQMQRHEFHPQNPWKMASVTPTLGRQR